jgi:hypothetical protein
MNDSVARAEMSVANIAMEFTAGVRKLLILRGRPGRRASAARVNLRSNVALYSDWNSPSTA